MTLKFNKAEWEKKYNKCIDYDDLENMVETEKHFGEIFEDNKNFHRDCERFNFIVSMIMYGLFVFLAFTLSFLPWLLPILFLKGLAK